MDFFCSLRGSAKFFLGQKVENHCIIQLYSLLINPTLQVNVRLFFCWTYGNKLSCSRQEDLCCRRNSICLQHHKQRSGRILWWNEWHLDHSCFQAFSAKEELWCACGPCFSLQSTAWRMQGSDLRPWPCLAWPDLTWPDLNLFFWKESFGFKIENSFKIQSHKNVNFNFKNRLSKKSKFGYLKIFDFLNSVNGKFLNLSVLY